MKLSVFTVLLSSISWFCLGQNRSLFSLVVAGGFNFSSETGQKLGDGYGAANYHPYTAYKHPVTPSYWIGIKKSFQILKNISVDPEFGVYLRTITYQGNRDTVLWYQHGDNDAILNTSYFYTSLDLNINLSYHVRAFELGIGAINRMYIYGHWERENCRYEKYNEHYTIPTRYSIRPAIMLGYKVLKTKPIDLTIFSRWEYWRKGWTTMLFGVSLELSNPKG